MTRPRWTQEEDAYLRERWLAGDELDSIAASIGSSRQACAARLHNLGISVRRPTWTAEEATRLERMAREGRTIEETALELGRSRSATKRMARALGVRFRRSNPVWTPKEDALLARYIGDGMTSAEAAKLLGRSPGACRQRAHSLGVPFPITPGSSVVARRQNTLRDWSPIALSGLQELERGLEWIARHTEDGQVVYGRLRESRAEAVGRLLFSLYEAARKARGLPLTGGGGWRGTKRGEVA